MALATQLHQSTFPHKLSTVFMRILLCSHWFAPSVGGVEVISQLLADAWVRQGCQVTVVTQTLTGGHPEPSRAFAVERQPRRSRLIELGRHADLIVQNTISLNTLLPLMLTGKPIAVIHQSWLRRGDGSRGWENHVKLFAMRFLHNFSISHAIAADIPLPSVVVGNPFAAEEFRGLRDHPRSADLVFLGRLIEDKGCGTLIEALRILKQRGLTPTLTVIGDGSYRQTIEEMVRKQGLTGQVTFLGAITQGRAEIVARHRIMVVPSLWNEPFGVVALEGIASGCAVIASSGGGLPDAVGSTGLLFPNGDSAALADGLEQLLTDPALRRRILDAGPEHLRSFEPDAVAANYFGYFHKWST